MNIMFDLAYLKYAIFQNLRSRLKYRLESDSLPASVFKLCYGEAPFLALDEPLIKV